MTDDIVTSDIVTRLRAWAKEAPTLGQAFDLLHVADEIERLRAEVNSMASAQAGWGRVARLNDEIERLRREVQAWRDAAEAYERGALGRGDELVREARRG